jgi:hypothetical protein
MSSYNMRGRMQADRTDETLALVAETKHKVQSERRRAAREKYKRDGISSARNAVSMAERGYGWKQIVQITHCDDSFARLIVLGTD